jgi:hypothetical protein
MSTVRQTSIDAYNEIKNNGLLKKLHWQVYSHLYHHGPQTSGEVYQQLGVQQRVPSQLRARFTELREMGVLQEVGERPCGVTGRTCIVWDVTAATPVPLPKAVARPSRASVLEAACYVTEAMKHFNNVPRSVADLLQWVLWDSSKRRGGGR